MHKIIKKNILDKIRKKYTEFYYKNKISDVNPDLLSDDEILICCEKYNTNIIIESKNEILTLKDKFDDIFDASSAFSKSKIPQSVIIILNRLLEISNNSFIVGGCVRDIILKEEPKDFDFVTDIPYEKLKKLFNTKDCSFKETGKNFLVFNLNFEGNQYEIANFRTEIYKNSRNPECEIGTIEDDLNRRDFTINNIYYNFNEGLIANEISFLDIQNKVLRFVGDPDQRLKEDYLRGWRFFRFLSKLKDFKPEKNSLKSIRRNWKNIYQKSNDTRVLLELEKLI